MLETCHSAQHSLRKDRQPKRHYLFFQKLDYTMLTSKYYSLLLLKRTVMHQSFSRRLLSIQPMPNKYLCRESKKSISIYLHFANSTLHLELYYNYNKIFFKIRFIDIKIRLYFVFQYIRLFGNFFNHCCDCCVSMSSYTIIFICLLYTSPSPRD